MAAVPRAHPRRLPRLILAALCAVVAGCGSADSSTGIDEDRQQIQAAVERLMESERVEDQCRTGVSERFIREVYVTVARCREANKRYVDDDEAASATISATRIDGGDKATTAVTLTSAKGARATGRLALVNVGGTWKVDRLGVDFLRSIFASLPTEAETDEERLVLSCLAEATRALSDGELRRVGNLMVGQRLEADSFPPGTLHCIRRGSKATPTG